MSIEELKRWPNALTYYEDGGSPGADDANVRPADAGQQRHCDLHLILTGVVSPDISVIW